MIIFHRILIGTFVAFSAGFAVWSLLLFRSSGGALPLLLGLGSVVVAAGFVYYLKHLHRFLGR